MRSISPESSVSFDAPIFLSLCPSESTEVKLKPGQDIAIAHQTRSEVQCNEYGLFPGQFHEFTQFSPLKPLEMMHTDHPIHNDIARRRSEPIIDEFDPKFAAADDVIVNSHNEPFRRIILDATQFLNLAKSAHKPQLKPEKKRDLTNV